MKKHEVIVTCNDDGDCHYKGLGTNGCRYNGRCIYKRPDDGFEYYTIPIVPEGR